MRAFAVLRVSTVDQLDGYGMDAQMAAISRFAEREGYDIVATFRDEGVSGSAEWHERPGLSEALARIGDGEAEALIVYRMDRLARNLLIQEVIVERLARAGVKLLSATEDMVNGESDPTRDMIRQILGAVAQYEKATTLARMAAGRAIKKARGEHIGGRVPFGYDKRGDGMLVPNDSEQAIIAQARELHAEGFSFRTIADEVGPNPRTGHPFHHVAVARMCRQKEIAA